MAEISQSEFLQMQQERQAARAAQAQRPSGPRVGYFKLADDGDEAIVRFAYTDPSQLKVNFVHPVTIEGKFRKVNCLSDGRNQGSCPLCAAGQRSQAKTYIKLINYVRDETTGQVTAQPQIWERPVAYNNTLQNYFTEYGDLSNCVFKVKRNGAKGSRETTYTITYCLPTVYNEQVYKKDFSAFDNYKVLGHAVLDKSFAEVQELVGDAQINQPTIQPQQHQTFTPQAAQAQSAVIQNESYYGQGQPQVAPNPPQQPIWSSGSQINVQYK